MNVGAVLNADATAFGPLLVPEIADRISKGEPFTVLGLAEGDVACGVLAGLWLDSAFQIMSIYVAPDYRRKGGGRQLVQTLVGAIHDLDKPTKVTMGYTEYQNDHQTLAPFLEHLGFESVEEDIPFSTTTLGALVDGPFFKTQIPPLAGAFTLEKLPGIQYKTMAQKFQVSGDQPMAKQLLSPDLDKSISVAHKEQGGGVSLVLLERWAEDHLCMTMAMSAQPMILAQLLRMAFSLALENYSPTTKLTIQAVNDSGADLLERLVPNGQIVSHAYHLTRVKE